MCRLYQEIAKYVDDYAERIYRKKEVILRVKNDQKAPRFVPFCSMYGDVLSYPVEEAGVATMDQMGRDGAPAHCAPHTFPSLKRGGSSAGRTRTYNQPVNSRLLYH